MSNQRENAFLHRYQREEDNWGDLFGGLCYLILLFVLDFRFNQFVSNFGLFVFNFRYILFDINFRYILNIFSPTFQYGFINGILSFFAS